MGHRLAALVQMPVFTVSANDYLRLEGRMQADGESSTFSRRADTEIPAVQRYIKELSGKRWVVSRC
jgi:hypothetical protein